MGRRAERELKRLGRIHRKRLLIQAEKLKKCLERDACERQDCAYFALPEDVEELVEFACEILAEAGGEKSESDFAFDGEEA